MTNVYKDREAECIYMHVSVIRLNLKLVFHFLTRVAQSVYS
jgi:hypothetical protein